MAMALETVFVTMLVNLILSAQGSDMCEDYKLRCQLRHHIQCRERVGGAMSTSLQSSVSLTCPYLYEAQSFSWTFVNTTDGKSTPILDQSNRVLSLHNINRSHEGAYQCTADNSAQPEITEIFLFVAAPAYFHSCPEANNGRNCTSTQQLQTVVNGSVVFNTRVAYRSGGNCGKRQEVRYLMLKKNGKSVYFCANFGSLKQRKCMNNSRVSVVSQMEDKFDFKLMLNGVGEADAGDYELELNVADAEGYLASSIYRKFSLLVSQPVTTTTVPELPTTEPHCVGNNQRKPDLMLMLDDEVLSNNTNITGKSLGPNEHVLLCIVADERCCTNHQGEVKADFLWPNGTVVEDGYVTRGRQVVRLHSLPPSNEMALGKYCCTTTSQDLNSDPVCVSILEV